MVVIEMEQEFVLLDYKISPWSDIKIFNLNCFNPTSNFVIISSEEYEKMNPKCSLSTDPKEYMKIRDMIHRIQEN